MGEQRKATKLTWNGSSVLKIERDCAIIAQAGTTPDRSEQALKWSSPVTGRRACPSVLWRVPGSTGIRSRVLYNYCTTSTAGECWRKPYCSPCAITLPFCDHSPEKERAGAAESASPRLSAAHHANSRRATWSRLLPPPLEVSGITTSASPPPLSRVGICRVRLSDSASNYTLLLISTPSCRSRTREMPTPATAPTCYNSPYVCPARELSQLLL